MLTSCVFIATIILGIVMGTKEGASTGWTWIAGGVVATGITYKLEEMLNAITRRLRKD